MGGQGRDEHRWADLGEGNMSASVDDVAFVVETMARTAVENEGYFGDLDAVVGTGTSATRWHGVSRSCSSPSATSTARAWAAFSKPWP